MSRTQFTFYESFYSALSRIKKKADRATAYDAICKYALYETEPDIDSLPDAAAIAFELIRPVLDTAKMKAAGGKKPKNNGKKSGSQDEDSGKKQERPQEDATNIPERPAEESGKEKEGEVEEDGEIEDECPPIPPKGGEKADAAFNSFWAAYPRKQGRGAARKAFQKARKKASLETMLSAIERQKRSTQWTRDGGQYIPQPATWLNQERWSDELDAGYQNGGGYDGNGPETPGGGGFKPSSGFRGW